MRTLALALLAVSVAAPTLATENKVVKCRTYMARMAGSSGGPR